MSSRYESSPANLRSLRDRLTQAAKREGILFGRLQQHVAVLVVAQFMSAASTSDGRPLLLVKGGASLELRRGIPSSRTSKDLDAVTGADMQVVYEQLADAGAVGWEGFTAQFTPPAAFEVPGLSTPAQRFTAKLSYHGKPFASVPVEVSAVEAGNAERYDAVASDALALVGLPPADAVPCMTLPWQVAQKLHACTDPVEEPRTNDRAHDLVDLLLIEALLVDEPLADTRAACLAVFRARRRQTWPPAIAPRRHWEPIYRRALEGLSALDLPPSAVEAAERVQAFVDRIDVA
ncbi:MAG TPA: nucleotidyl transferase AbiEii/AbiGii toxin family protein [Armatimonadota bacterium]|nr:nucleotidyl transferase AbiEii/AbiGii toxin family protein [Dermatophilaceae bacterium]HQK95014.1 nucleotidyl transferase AbiEii/AbiGii toxin family protein [Armatimonadota bacterium]